MSRKEGENASRGRAAVPAAGAHAIGDSMRISNPADCRTLKDPRGSVPRSPGIPSVLQMVLRPSSYRTWISTVCRAKPPPCTESLTVSPAAPARTTASALP